MQAYHCSSLRSSDGIPIILPGAYPQSFAVSSFASLSHCYLAILYTAERAVKSLTLHITHKNTEFTFSSSSQSLTGRKAEDGSRYNSLLDCHREMWTQFPVEPAVLRQTVKQSNRVPRELKFISKLPSHLCARYYASMVSTFESTTRKPGHSRLLDTRVSGTVYTKFAEPDMAAISTFRTGEWLVELLCLIPIHIAKTHDNQFVPVKDGIWSLESQRALLGATVNEVTNSISFGWYESIFESYMAMKVASPYSSVQVCSV